MGDTILPLIFLLAVSFYYYGLRPIVITAVSVSSCVVFEYLYRRILGKSRSIGDLSAIVTGLILAFCMPVTVPLWFPIVGGFFAIVVVKQLYGGLGKNIFNPAAAAVCFLTVTWPGVMSVFPLPTKHFAALATPHNFETGRTVLSALKDGQLPDNNFFEMLIGYTPGNFGTVAALMVLIAAFVLLYRRIISWRIPVGFLGAVAVAALIFPRCPSGRLDSAAYELLSGSVIFVAVFMATDPVTSPVTSMGRFLYGVCCGILTVVLRYFGIYPEGAFFALLIMNPFVLVFDRIGWKLKVKGGRLLYEQE